MAPTEVIVVDVGILHVAVHVDVVEQLVVIYCGVELCYDATVVAFTPDEDSRDGRRRQGSDGTRLRSGGQYRSPGPSERCR